MKTKPGKILLTMTLATGVEILFVLLTVLITYLVRIHNAAVSAYEESVYTPNLIRLSFFILLFPFLIYLTLIVYSGICFSKEPVREKVKGLHRIKSNAPMNKYVILSLRIVVGLAAVIFLVVGILNKGNYAVWVKAANICRECVGIG